MVYKRYIKRGGKVFGPYYYESYRNKDGRVKTRFISGPGVYQKKSSVTVQSIENSKQFVYWFAILSVAIGLFAVLFISMPDFSEEQFFSAGIDKSVQVFHEVSSFITGLASQEDGSGEISEGEQNHEEASQESPTEEVGNENTVSEEESGAEESIPDGETGDEEITPDEEIGSKEETIDGNQGVEIMNESVQAEENETSNETIDGIFEDNTQNESAENETSESEVVENMTETNQTTLNETLGNLTNEDINQTGNATETVINETLANQTISNVTINDTTSNQTLINITNETVEFSNFTTKKRAKIIINRQVKWIEVINASQNKNVKVKLPKDAENITVKTGEEVKTALDELEKFDDKVENADRKELVEGSITGFVSLDLEKERGVIGKLIAWLSKSVITGKVIEEEEIKEEIIETDEGKEVNLAEIIKSHSEDEIAVEYYTAPPIAVEEETKEGKKVIVSAPDELEYEDILAFTEIPEKFDVGQKDLIKIHWIENNSFIEFDPYDLDSDNKIDYIEWVVPHLSNQTYEIILITKAERLDSNRTFISDIYDEVYQLDGNWSETISEGEYVRVVFERNLTSSNDITVFPRTLSGSPKIEIYEKDGSDIIAFFDSLSENELNKVYLSNLNGEQDSFDLLILSGSVEFDWIVDPDTGFKSPSTTGSPLNQWSSGGDIVSSDDKWATETTVGQKLDTSDYSFNIPAGSIIDGINVSVEGKASGRSGTATLGVDLSYDGGTSYTTEKTKNFNIAADQFQYFGGATDTWGRTWNSSETNNTNFRARINYNNGGRDGAAFNPGIDHIQIKIYYTEVDSTPPSVTINFPVDGGNYSNADLPLNFNVSLNENGTVRYSLNGGVNNLTMSSTDNQNFNASNNSIADGTYTFSVYANDTSGNNNWTESVDFNFFNFPYATLNSPANASVFSLNVFNITLNATALDNTAGDTIDVFLYGVNSTSTGNFYKHGLLYQRAGVNNNTEITYNWTSPVTVPDSSTVLLMHMDNNSNYGESNSLVYDFALGINNGTVNGNAFPNITGGKFAGGFQFDGNGDYIEIADHNSIDFDDNGNYTWSAWIKTSQTRVDDQYLFSKIGGFCAGICPGYVILIEEDNSVSVAIPSETGDGTSNIVSSTGTLTANKWYHLAVTFNTENNIKIYIDGTEDGSGGNTGFIDETSVVVRLSSTDTNALNGTMDEVAIWNRTLSATEIKDLYRLNVDKYFWKVNVTDSDGNNNESETREFNIEDNGNPTGSYVSPTENTGVFRSRNYIEVNVTASDDYLESILVRLYNSTQSQINSSLTSSSPNYINFSGLSEGVYYYNATANDTANNKVELTTRNITLDRTNPSISSLTETPSDPATYSSGGTYRFNATISDTYLQNVLIEFNGANYTPSNSGSVYNFSIADLAVGSYNYYWRANDSAGNVNVTSNSYTINKATPSGSLTNSEAWDVTYPTEVTIGYSESNNGDGDVTYKVYRDNVDKGSGETVTLAAGSYSYLLNTTGGQNYSSTASIDSKTLGVSKGNSEVNLTLNSTEGNITINEDSSILLNGTFITGDSSATLRLYNDGNLINEGATEVSNQTTFSTPGLYNVTVIYVESQNYSQSSETYWVRVEDITPPSVTINFPVDGGNYSNADLPLNFNVSLNENGTVRYSLNGGVNNLTMSSTDNQNFNATNSSIADGTYTFSVYANDTSGNNNWTTSSVFIFDSVAPAISNAKINATSPVLINTIVKVNASATDSSSGIGTVLIQVDPPSSSPYNITAQKSGNEYYNNSVLLNQEGQWVFTFFANDTAGNDASSAVAQDLASNNYIETESNRIGLIVIYPTGNVNVTRNVFFNISLNVSCLTGSCGEINVSVLFSENQTEAFSVVNAAAGASPFWTNASNPRNITLSWDENEVVNFFINATGASGTNHTFIANANLTSNMSTSNATSQWNVSITNAAQSISISLSDKLGQQINWTFNSLPVFNLSADGNNGNGTANYWVNISTDGGLVDLYVKANSDLTTSSGDILGLGNETYSYNSTNSSVPSTQKFALTTTFSDNKIGSGLGDSSVVYLKFFVSAPTLTPAGTYNNTLEFKAVGQGVNPD